MSDDLSKINGVGPATVEKLKGRGIEAFAQIAALSDDQVLQLNEELDLRDSIINHDWRSQAKSLMSHELNPSPEPAPAEKPAQTIPVRINRDFWDAQGDRHRKGTVIEVSVEEALDGVESGALSRVKS